MFNLGKRKPINFAVVAWTIRKYAAETASCCAQITNPAEGTFDRVLIETLSYSSAIAVNEVCAKRRVQSSQGLETAIEDIKAGFHSAEIVPETPEGMALGVFTSDMVVAGAWQFDSRLRHYWNGDLDGLVITPAEIDRLKELGIDPVVVDGLALSYGALIMRIARQAKSKNGLAPILLMMQLAKIIKSDGESFIEELRHRLK